MAFLLLFVIVDIEAKLLMMFLDLLKNLWLLLISSGCLLESVLS